jgi:eukaryotic-like serine/threonine-protein kinase
MIARLSEAAIRRLQWVTDAPDLSHTKYEIVEGLGRGGMGTVYLARDRELDRQVALKIVGTPTVSLDAVERLEREARILAALEHPGIVPVHDVGRVPDGRTFYAMKLVRGHRLGEHVTPATTLAERLQVFERICEAVAFAHAHGIIHRDLKPDNVMVGPFGEVLVMDWGLAKLGAAAEPRRPASTPAPPPSDGPAAGDGPPTASGVVLGTPGYMAPEQARGDTGLTDERSDVHGLGAILGFLLADHTSPATPHLRKEFLPGVPRPLQAIVGKATEPDPDCRYQKVVQLAADLAHFRGGLPVAAYPETLVDRSRRLVVKYRVPVGLVVAYVVMRVLLLIFARR